jgi:hypothetical protein
MWIKVTDQLPPEGEDVMVYGQVMYSWRKTEWRVFPATWKGGWAATDHFLVAKEVTHWQPFPDKPAST